MGLALFLDFQRGYCLSNHAMAVPSWVPQYVALSIYVVEDNFCFKNKHPLSLLVNFFCSILQTNFESELPEREGSLLLYLYLGLNRPALLRVWPQLPMMYKKNYMAFTYVLKIIKSTYHAQNSGVELRRENFQHKILFFSSIPFSSTFITFSFLTFSHFHLFIKVAIYLYSKLII